MTKFIVIVYHDEQNVEAIAGCSDMKDVRFIVDKFQHDYPIGFVISVYKLLEV